MTEIEQFIREQREAVEARLAKIVAEARAKGRPMTVDEAKTALLWVGRNKGPALLGDLYWSRCLLDRALPKGCLPAANDSADYLSWGASTVRAGDGLDHGLRTGAVVRGSMGGEDRDERVRVHRLSRAGLDPRRRRCDRG